MIEGKSREALLEEARLSWEALTLSEHVAYYEQQGMDRKEAMRLAAKDRGISKREVYQALLKESQD